MVQPDGKLAVWSTGLDNFIMVDATDEELVTYYAEMAYREAANGTAELIAKLRNGKNPYYQFAYTWEEANKIREGTHDEDES